MSDIINETTVRKAVRDRYTKLAQGGFQDPYCKSGDDYVSMIGYEKDKVAGLPAEALEISAGCGNPTAIASLTPGQTVLDLGSGGGIDVLISSKEVGPTGRVIGVDATPDMIWKARENARKVNATNVEFRLGEIECLPVETGTVDVIISNCVINLSPDKDRTFREAFRVLKSGGKLAVSDMVTTKALTASEAELLSTWASCIGGAIAETEYIQKIKDAGFVDVVIESRHVYTKEELTSIVASDGGCGCGCGTTSSLVSLEGMDADSRIASIKISARKP